MMLLSFVLTAALDVAVFTRPALADELSFESKIGATEFVGRVARYCIQPKTRAEVLGKTQVRIVGDEPKCSDELKALALRWDRLHHGDDVQAVHVPIKRQTAVGEAVKARFGGDLGLLTSTPDCDCLVFAGRDASDRARVARTEAMAPTPRTASH